MDEQNYSPETVQALLTWYRDMGVDEVTGNTPSDFAEWGAAPTFPKPKSVRQQAAVAPALVPNQPAAHTPPHTHKAKPTKPHIPAATAPATISGRGALMPDQEAIAQAQALSSAANTIEELSHAISSFDGCPLKPGARNTVVGEGVFEAPLMVIGEAPTREEDQRGQPFMGPAGDLLDAMLAAIGHGRHPEDKLAPAWLTTTIFWRPPGNRPPTASEIAICLPFVHRMIDLAQPKVLIVMGNTPTQTLFPATTSIIRARGNWQNYTTTQGITIPTCPMFHPSFLLRQPSQKRLAWDDLCAVRTKLRP